MRDGQRLSDSTQLDELAAENAQLRARCEQLTTTNQALSETVDMLVEPAQQPPCDKVRLRDQDEAEQFARRVENDLGLAPGEMMSYPCKICPRQPVTLAKFWHVCNTKKSQRGQRGRNRHRRRGPGLATHIDRSVITQVRQSATGGAP